MNLRAFATEEARRQGLDPSLVLRVMQQESGGNPKAVSPKGARGPMQLMPGTARELGVNPDDPQDNIRGGVRYLKQQMDRFGSPHLALAAYNAGPGAVQRARGVPHYAETEGYVRSIMGSRAQQSGADIFEMDDEPHAAGPGTGADIFADATPVAEPPPMAPTAPPVAPQAAAHVSQTLGFQKGAIKPLDNAAKGLEWLVDKATGSTTPGRFSHMLGGPSAAEAADSHAAYVAGQAQKGIRPGKLGEFAGNVAGTLPLALLPGGVGVQGMAGGAALSDAKDAGGLALDTLIGGVAGKVGDKLVKGAGGLVGNVLGKAPKVLSLPELETAKKAAYQTVDSLGVTYRPAATQQLARDIATDMSKLRVSPLRHPAAASVLKDVTAALKGKAPLTLSQLDELRQVVWRDAAGLKDPDRAAEAMIGQKIIERLDGFMDTATTNKVIAGDPEVAAKAIRTARDLNTRWRKSLTVANELDSAELRKSAAYSGANTDNTIRQRLRPLVDPTSGKRIRNASADEQAALRKVVEGTPLQNLSRLTGQGLDPRKLLGKISGIGAAGSALHTGGLSLLGPALGLVGTTVSNRASQKNVEELLRLIAAGGSKQALKKAPTAASRAALAAAARARPAAGLIGASAAAQLREP